MFVPIQTKRQGDCGLANFSRHLSLPRAIRKLLLLKRRAWRRWRLNHTAPNKADFNMASRRCSTKIRRYLENQELRLLGIAHESFLPMPLVDYIHKITFFLYAPPPASQVSLPISEASIVMSFQATSVIHRLT